MNPRAALLSLGAAALVVPLLLGDAPPTGKPKVIRNDLCIVAPATPYDPASGLPMIAPRPIPAGARCPVCGMYPARHPHWSAQVIFRDGAVHYFDSPIDLFVFLQRVDHYDRRYTRGDVIARYVRDVESGQWIDAPAAFFVQGSEARGPMRTADLPAFASRDAAAAFARRHGGAVVAAAQITPAVLQGLYRGAPHQH
ncbi:nitrous oxide reductase accessory protein NosL [Thiobacillus sedimenti]|uniref:Nitrous oxide reductase accessory protein NosL n=1 Tax=Thiobacillus sedimenti TaxID=3110231 RepID=A0ABZ1CMC5_9PROT|nr:nitrous oxide reductase accessory protein NosL [Thiobacillus sp. SCUT-2]WRS40547.1 nitrous oxide reductase accessory protein NosL [Thiobacillus sp. SCUT-2]